MVAGVRSLRAWAGVAALAIVGALLARVVEPGVTVEPLALGDTPALRFRPAGPRRGTAVLAHGVSANKHTMFRVGEALAAAGLEVIAIDFPGHGASSLPFVPRGGTAPLAAAARRLNGAPAVDLLVGHSLGAYREGAALRRGEVSARALVAFGALPDVGAARVRLWYLGGGLEELLPARGVQGWAADHGATVVFAPLADHVLEPYAPRLVDAAVGAAAAVLDQPRPPAPRRWWWRLVGAALLVLAAALAVHALAPRAAPVTGARAALRGAACAAAPLLAAHLAGWTWIIGAPSLRRVQFALALTVAALLASWGLGLAGRAFSRARPATAGHLLGLGLLLLGALVATAAGARFFAMIGGLAVVLLGVGTGLGARAEASAGAAIAARAAFALWTGWVLGMWCPLPW